MECPSCGEEHPSDADFCTSCGSKLVDDREESLLKGNTETDEELSKWAGEDEIGTAGSGIGLREVLYFIGAVIASMTLFGSIILASIGLSLYGVSVILPIGISTLIMVKYGGRYFYLKSTKVDSWIKSPNYVQIARWLILTGLLNWVFLLISDVLGIPLE